MVRFNSASLILLSSALAVVHTAAASNTTTTTTATTTTAQAGPNRGLAFDRYAGYVPTTLITDIAAIDLDQLEFNEQLTARKVVNAWSVYEMGGHSGSFAGLRVSLGNNAATSFHPAGTRVIGNSSSAQVVTGTLLDDVKWDGSATKMEIRVRYDVGNSQATYVSCQVGGLYVFQKANRTGCFSDTGTVRLIKAGDPDTQGAVYGYEYDQRIDNNNTLTLKSLSTNATNSMKGPNGAYYLEYQHFLDYYGDTDYADKWISAARYKTNTGFKTSFGDSDFTLITGRPGQAEGMKKGAAYLNVWMEVVRELNEAVADCQAGIQGAEHSVDEAVAFYAGSLTTQESDEGILLYALAEVRAHQMRTAGHLDDKDVGDAYVNVEIFKELKKMQSAVSSGDTAMCTQAEESKNRIITLMKVPLVQGVMRYAYIRQMEVPPDADEEQKAQAEGATFAATILPFVHHCDSRVAKIIHENMKLGAKTNFRDVKAALERSYDCMGIVCDNVGGVWDHESANYKSGAAPCGISTDQKSGSAIGGIVGITVGVLLAGWLFLRYRHKLFVRKTRKSMPPMYTGNIAAVTEIA